MVARFPDGFLWGVATAAHGQARAAVHYGLIARANGFES